MSDPLDTLSGTVNDASQPTISEAKPASRAEARQYIQGASGDSGTGVGWTDIESDIDDLDDYLTDAVRGTLAWTGLDGIALEFSVGADAGVVVGGEVSTGISVFWPLRSTYDPPANVPHPIDDAPHFYLFTSEGLTFGVDIGGGVGVGGQLVLADHWGGPEKITRASWGGSVVSIDFDGALALGVGAEISVTAYFTAVTSTGSGPGATVTWGQPEAGWHGAGVAVSPRSGVELELSTGITVTNALDGVIDFGRSDVSRGMQTMPEIDGNEDIHYRRPEQGPGLIHALIETLAGI